MRAYTSSEANANRKSGKTLEVGLFLLVLLCALCTTNCGGTAAAFGGNPRASTPESSPAGSAPSSGSKEAIQVSTPPVEKTSPGNNDVAQGGESTTSAVLVAAPAVLNFGNVVVAGGKSSVVTLGNAGNGSLTVHKATLSGPGFSISGLSLPMELAPGATTSFTVTFSPGNSGAASGSISFESTSSSQIAISLTGTSTNPTIHAAELMWAASASNVAGYNVYRASRSGGPYTKINPVLASLSYADTTVSSGQAYYYVVTAVDGNRAESEQSNEAYIVIP